MWRRYVSVLAVVGAFAGVSEAQAATAKKVKPVCDLVTDPSGDVAIDGVPHNDSNLDIVSADIASNSTTLTAAIRLTSAATEDPNSPLGQAFYFFFSVPGSATQYFLTARLYPTGNHFYFGFEKPDAVLPVNDLIPTADATGVLDTANKQYRISVPFSSISSTLKLKPGETLSGLQAVTDFVIGQGVVASQNVGPTRVPFGGLSTQADTATSKNAYKLGTPSCVPVGK